MVTDLKKPIDVRSTVTDETSKDGFSPAGSPSATHFSPAASPGAAQPGAETSTSNTGPSSNASPATDSTTTSGPSGYAISTSVPEEFKGSSNQELIDFLRKKVAEHKPLSEEEVAKLRRKQKVEGIISGISDATRAISNLIFTHHYAPNMYNGNESMSAKSKERFDKAKADREAEDDRYFRYAMQLAATQGADKDRGLQIWQTEQNLARQDRAYDDGRKDRAEDIEFRNKDFDTRVSQWEKNFEREGKWHEEEAQRWERQFIESIRQFNVSAANERARIGMEAQRLAHSMKDGQMTFNLGSGNGNVTLTLDRLNAQTVSRIYSTLPESVRGKVQGDPIMGKDEFGNTAVIGYKDPSTEAMLIAIGANVESSPNTQKAIKEVAGIKQESMSGNGTKMPGVK